MEDEEILNTVHSMFGKSAKIVDCQKTSSVQQEEILLINGVEIKLDAMPNDEALAIKTALLDGQQPSIDLLNRLLYQAGLEQQPIELETSLSIKSSLITKEAVSVSRKGMLLDEKTSETKEDYLCLSKQKETLYPVRGSNIPELSRDCSLKNALRYNESSSTIGTNNSTLDANNDCLEQEFSNYSTLSNITANDSSSSMQTYGKNTAYKNLRIDANSLSNDSGHEDDSKIMPNKTSSLASCSFSSNSPIITMPKVNLNYVN